MASRDSSAKKALNGDSPAFTPGPGNSPLRKSSALPLQAANAAPFTPRGTSVVSTSNASSSASPREQLRDPVTYKEPSQTVPRADASSSAFNLATVREFVPRASETTGNSYNLASAKEFQPRGGDRSPFNVAKAVEFRPQSQTALPPSATPTSTSSLPSQAHSSPPQTSHQQQHHLHLQQAQMLAQPQQQPVSSQTAHLGIPTGPAQSSQMAIPTGPSRGSNHASNTIDHANSNRTNSAAAMGMGGIGGMGSIAYGLSPGSEGQMGHAGGLYDSFGVGPPGGPASALTTSPYDLYASTSQAGAGREGAAYFQGQTPFATTQHQPLAEHLYFPQGPHRQDLLPRQRAVHDFFLPEKLRQDIHMKARAGNQAALTLSVNVESYHSLTPLDTNSHKVAGAFGRITWLYKAVASKNGKHYCLRRVENFRVSNENALRAARDWRRVNSGSVVTVHEAFTTRAFGDSSVVFAMDYFPLSVTLMQYHFPTFGQSRPRGNVTIQETILWGYFVQIANALRAIHATGLAARSVDLTKIIRTGKNRIRLSGCAVQDVINYDPARRVLDLQQEDFIHFGEVMYALATYTPPNELKRPLAPAERLPEIYSHELRSVIVWLLTPAPPPPPSSAAGSAGANPAATKNIDTLINGISTQMAKFFDMSLQENDGLTSMVFREVENGRVARMLLKLGTINERESYQRDATWAEHGPRYPLKLFRDYVFHQVDEAGRPVVDAWHMLSCLNKLDAASNDVVRLSSRDGRTNLFVTYKELNKMVQRSFNDLIRAGRRHN
ncbi:Protein kinase-like domain protein [Niveomyces insectorum RCEF 264]|uniref:PAN2-PAN3 deadenylation complex subunit PAN3 n=1 Tax=Niveomyces insectorum RCEF 264 TaxID=1081102 RepID=A0A162MKI7_9HYPO|nr:Protein kinase-like domain protein [Niveomyces insectorum RCEF 264]